MALAFNVAMSAYGPPATMLRPTIKLISLVDVSAHAKLTWDVLTGVAVRPVG